MANEVVGLFEAMRTQRAIRSLKADPIPDELVEQMIELATKAPNGSNRQPWMFIAVRDKQQLAKLKPKVQESLARIAAATTGAGQSPLGFDKFTNLIEHFEDVPLVIYPCAVLGPGEDLSGPRYFSSLFPAIQNLLLAARELGLGAVLTGQILGAKEVLGLPDNVEPMAMIPIGYPDQDHYGPTTRKPVAEVLRWDRW